MNVREKILRWFVAVENLFYAKRFNSVLGKGWIGVDFDGTLTTGAVWDGEIGEPIESMIKRVKQWLVVGIEVRIMTASVGSVYPDQIAMNQERIIQFCLLHFGKELPITNEKDQHMIALWDDRAFNPHCLSCTSYETTSR